MNRRELFQSVAGIAAASGVTLTASTVDAEAKPALSIIGGCGHAWQCDASAIFQPCPACGGADTNAYQSRAMSRVGRLNASGRPLNRRLDETPDASE